MLSLQGNNIGYMNVSVEGVSVDVIAREAVEQRVNIMVISSYGVGRVHIYIYIYIHTYVCVCTRIPPFSLHVMV
jgi:hypothetical protein